MYLLMHQYAFNDCMVIMSFQKPLCYNEQFSRRDIIEAVLHAKGHGRAPAKAGILSQAG